MELRGDRYIKLCKVEEMCTILISILIYAQWRTRSWIRRIIFSIPHLHTFIYMYTNFNSHINRFLLMFFPRPPIISYFIHITPFQMFPSLFNTINLVGWLDALEIFTRFNYSNIDIRIQTTTKNIRHLICKLK